jgi:hypothetical protein
MLDSGRKQSKMVVPNHSGFEGATMNDLRKQAIAPPPYTLPEIPYGYCHCGCGKQTPIATKTCNPEGRRAGEPCPFLTGHRGVSLRPDDVHAVVDGKPCVWIALTQGKFSLVDAADYETVKAWKWHTYHKRGRFYAVRSADEDQPHNPVGMHQQLMGVRGRAALVDHMSGDGLDNRRHNLRLCTNAQNVRNQRLHIDSKSGFKGVDFHKNAQKWRARIVVNYEHINLGLFDTAEDAAAAYDAAAVRLHGEFARTNKIAS